MAAKMQIAAGILPYIKEDEFKFLLIRNSICWEFPKGVIENGESLLSAAKRETEEETGLIINNIHPSFKYVVKYFLTKNYSTGEKLKTPQPKTVTYFLGEAQNKNVRLSFEHDFYDWFTFHEAQKLLKNSYKKDVLNHAMNFLK